MSNAHAQIISAAVLRATELMGSQGETPVSAFCKVATAMNLSDHQIDRVCQLYNRAAQLGDRVTDPNAQTKFAAVPGVLDPDSVKALVSSRRAGEHVMSKSASLAIYDELNQECSIGGSFLGLHERKFASIPAAEQTDSSRENKYAGLYHGMKRADAQDLLLEFSRKLAGLYTDIRQQVSRAKGTLLDVVNRVANDINRLHDVEAKSNQFKQACFAFRDCGEGTRFIAMVADNWLDCLPNFKRASLCESIVDFTPSVLVPEYPCYASMAKTLGDIFSQTRDELQAKAAACAETRELASIVRSTLTNDGVHNTQFFLGNGTLADRQIDHVSKVASFFASFIGARMNGAKPAGGDGSNQTADRFKLQLGNPQHEAALATLRSRAALQQLLADDPIISQEDPNAVAVAFNELASYTPQAMQSPAVLRSALRQYLMNNTSASDLTAIRSLERAGQRRSDGAA